MGKEWIGLVVVMILVGGAAADTYEVGGDEGWRVPTNATFYEEWARNKTFEIGDSLEFKWMTTHNVLELTSKSEYDNCTTTNGTPNSISPVTIELKANGTFYFICTIGPHCSLGQKVAITVGAGNSTSPTPASSSPSNTANQPVTISAAFLALSFAIGLYFLNFPA